MGGLVVTTPPGAEPVSLTEAKAHLRLEHSSDDTQVTAMIVAARRQAEALTGLALIDTVFTWTFEGFPCGAIVLPRAPLDSITSIAYLDTSGTSTTLTVTTDYRVDAAALMPCVEPAYGTTWPLTYGVSGDVTVVFKAGYGTAGSDVPGDIRAAILLIVGAFYEHREDFVTGTIATPMPRAANDILGFYRTPAVLVAA